MYKFDLPLAMEIQGPSVKQLCISCLSGVSRGPLVFESLRKMWCDK